MIAQTKVSVMSQLEFALVIQDFKETSVNVKTFIFQVTNVLTYGEIEILYLQIYNVLVTELAQIEVPAIFQMEFVFVILDFKDKPVKVKLFFC